MLTVVAFKVKFTDSKGNVKDYDVTGQEEGTLLDAIKGAGIPIQSFFTVIDPSVDRCGGNCTCGTCAVLMSPALSDQTLMTAKESGLLRRRGKGKGYQYLKLVKCSYHLACQSIVTNFMEGEVIEINYCRKWFISLNTQYDTKELLLYIHNLSSMLAELQLLLLFDYIQRTQSLPHCCNSSLIRDVLHPHLHTTSLRLHQEGNATDGRTSRIDGLPKNREQLRVTDYPSSYSCQPLFLEIGIIETNAETLPNHSIPSQLPSSHHLNLPHPPKKGEFLTTSEKKLGPIYLKE